MNCEAYIAKIQKSVDLVKYNLDFLSDAAGKSEMEEAAAATQWAIKNTMINLTELSEYIDSLESRLQSIGEIMQGVASEMNARMKD